MSRRKQHSWMIVRVTRAHYRLAVAFALGVAISILSYGGLLPLPPHDELLATHLLRGWDLGVILYLVLASYAMSNARVADIRRRAAAQDEGASAILLLTGIAGLASFGAIIAELGHSKSPEPRELILATATILLSWTFVHTIFAVHYAHQYYSDDDRAGGLVFQGDEDPDYWDFVYFSFVIGMTSQVSDVAVACKPIRRTVTAHGIISFIFNAALLALTVNIAASAI